MGKLTFTYSKRINGNTNICDQLLYADTHNWHKSAQSTVNYVSDHVKNYPTTGGKKSVCCLPIIRKLKDEKKKDRLDFFNSEFTVSKWFPLVWTCDD